MWIKEDEEMGWFEMKRQKNTLIVVFIMTSLLLAACNQTSKDISNYLQTGTLLDGEVENFMPTLDSLPNYENIEYRHTRKKMFIFEANSVLLNVQYDDETYKKEKELLAKPDESADDTFSINSYTFWLAETNGYPKSFGIIGTSDEKKSIAYLYFVDFDLDTISTSMKTFVKDYFKYDFK